MIFSTPEQFVVLAIILVVGYLFGFLSAPSARKWKRKLRDQAESFTAWHADAEDRVRAAKDRAAALEAEAQALRADREEAERALASLKAAAVPQPVAAPAPAPVPLMLVETPVAEPETASEHPSDDARQAPQAPEPAAAEPDHPDHAHKIVDADFVDVPASVDPSGTVAVADAAPEAEPVIAHVAPETTTSEAVAQFPMTPTATDAPPAPIGPAEPEMPTKGWFGNSSRDDLTRLRSIDSALNTRLFGIGVLRFEDIEKLSAEDEMALEERLSLPAGFIAREQWRAQAALLRAGNEREHAERFGNVEAPAI